MLFNSKVSICLTEWIWLIKLWYHYTKERYYIYKEFKLWEVEKARKCIHCQFKLFKTICTGNKDDKLWRILSLGAGIRCLLF